MPDSETPKKRTRRRGRKALDGPKMPFSLILDSAIMAALRRKAKQNHESVAVTVRRMILKTLIAEDPSIAAGMIEAEVEGFLDHMSGKVPITPRVRNSAKKHLVTIFTHIH